MLGKKTGYCDTYWGSHGCDKSKGHKGDHECDCCDCLNRIHHILQFYIPFMWRGCVARWPYYGKDTKFYHMEKENGSLNG